MGDPSTQILGKWQASVGGFPIVVEYSALSVKIGDNDAVAYQLTEDQLSFANGGQQVRTVSFPNRNEMILADPLTGSTHTYKRLL